jgi:hypothetical protein
MNNILIDKISKFFEKEYYPNISKISIFQYENGKYELFDKYIIEKVINGFKVINKLNWIEKTFGNLKNAVAWCIFDEKNRVFETKRIEYLDIIIDGLESDITMHKKLLSSTKDVDQQIIYSAKLSQSQTKKTIYYREINKFINESKLLQTKKFASKR